MKMLFASLCVLVLIYETFACETSSFKNVRAVLSGQSKENPIDVILNDCMERDEVNKKYFTAEIINQNVERLNRGAFVNLTLTTLILSNNRIGNIDAQAFRKLRSVQNVDLSKNKLKTLSRNVFSEMVSLKILDLSNNVIDEIEDETFAYMVSLQELKLSSNRLKVWNTNWFANNLGMTKLEADENSIEILPENSFADMKKLKTLNIRANMIREIHPKAFKGLDELKTLDLSVNKLTKFHEDTFEPFNGILDLTNKDHDRYRVFGPINPFAGLWEFYFHTNNLTYFSEKMMKDLSNSRGLHSLSLHSNPWQCACYLNIIKWADSIRLRLNDRGKGCYRKDNPECVVPAKKSQECVPEVEEDLRSLYFSKWKAPVENFFDRNVVCNSW